MYGVNLNYTSTYSFENIKCTAHRQTSRGSGLGWVIRLDLTVFFFGNECMSDWISDETLQTIYIVGDLCLQLHSVSINVVHLMLARRDKSSIFPLEHSS
jgi:hypothetical protein